MGKAVVGLRPSFSAHVRPTARLGRFGEHGAPVRFPSAFATKQTNHARRGSRIVRRSRERGPLFRKKLNSGAVVCCADTVPGMREEIVLGAVVELVARTQLATDVETQSGNS